MYSVLYHILSPQYLPNPPPYYMAHLRTLSLSLIHTHAHTHTHTHTQVPGAARKIRADSVNPESINLREAMENGDTQELDIRDDRSDIVDLEPQAPTTSS